MMRPLNTGFNVVSNFQGIRLGISGQALWENLIRHGPGGLIPNFGSINHFAIRALQKLLVMTNHLLKASGMEHMTAMDELKPSGFLARSWRHEGTFCKDRTTSVSFFYYLSRHRFRIWWGQRCKSYNPDHNRLDPKSRSLCIGPDWDEFSFSYWVDSRGKCRYDSHHFGVWGSRPSQTFCWKWNWQSPLVCQPFQLNINVKLLLAAKDWEVILRQ